ncbi:MAG: hypothetical protein J4G11_10805 [Acidimicrobiia bacterium]|nr:hypothetical protein [Acidimicrobiia bacterium]
MGPADTRNRRKVLIFSYYADTVDWIVQHLVDGTETDPRLQSYRGRVAALSGSTRTQDKRTVVWGFAPKTTDAPEGFDDDLYDIVVTTDVLAEGVNLQQAGHIINYDLPWNPMRLVQRHGRIDRIGSLHSEIIFRCVFPDARLDDLLNLEERLHHKIKQASAAKTQPCSSGAEPAAVPSPERNTAKNSARPWNKACENESTNSPGAQDPEWPSPPPASWNPATCSAYASQTGSSPSSATSDPTTEPPRL